jgi:PAS domain S-box-containing protein
MNRTEDSPASFASEYASALREYVAGGGETALTRAYELGRAAAGEGLGILDVAMLHHLALAALPPAGPATGSPVETAAQFLAESLSPFEMTLRSYQANARLLGLSDSLAEQNAEIARAREQLRTILDATTAVIYLKDAEGRYLFVNRQFQEVFRLPRDAVVGKRDDEVLPPPVARTLQTGDAGVLGLRAPQQVEEILPSDDGPRTWLSVKFPLVDAEGRAYGVCCVATDITERKRNEEALARAREAAERERMLERAVQARDEFITVASHELRTPATCLELRVDMLRRLARSDPGARLDDPKVGAKLDALSRQVDRLIALMDTLVQVGKLSTGQHEPSREPLDLGELVRAVVASQREAIRRSGSEVVVRAAAPVTGTWDRDSLEAAVAQLLSNAVKFGEGKAIELAVRTAGDRAVLSVRDHGIGIRPEDHERIFARFERGVSEQNFGGFGLGLWIARHAAEAHGGTIAVESRPGDGARFTIELPREGG